MIFLPTKRLTKQYIQFFLRATISGFTFNNGSFAAQRTNLSLNRICLGRIYLSCICLNIPCLRSTINRCDRFSFSSLFPRFTLTLRLRSIFFFSSFPFLPSAVASCTACTIVICRLLLSESTLITTSETICFSSSRNCAAYMFSFQSPGASFPRYPSIRQTSAVLHG